jgi:hypothetical protein
MKLSGILSAFLSTVLSCPLWMSGQAPQDTSPPAAPEVYPDQGFLSATRYANRYFGFTFELPADARLEPVPQPVAPDGRIQILQMAGPPPAYATVSIFGFPLRTKTGLDSKAILRRTLDQELMRGVEQLHGLSKTTLAGHLFYFYETRRGADQHMALSSNLEGYAVVVMLAANNETTVKELEACFQRVVFIAPAKAREAAGPNSEEYEGPALSSHRLAQFRADPPANHIDAGKLAGNLYENPGLGFSYRIPAGWTLEADGAVQPAIERSRKNNYEAPWMGASERELMKVCNRILISAWAKRPNVDGQLSYDDFGEVTVSAAPTACFPGMKFPATTSDRRAVQDFLMWYGLTHPVVRDMRDAKAFSSGGNVVVFLHGTVAFQVPGDELSRRLSIAMAITSRRGYLLTWFFAAPHDSELRPLLDEQVAFDAEPPAKEASASKPGGGGAAGATSPFAVVNPGSEAAPSTAGGANGSTSVTQPQSEPPTGTSSQPTLLPPGEAVQHQQVKGQPLPQ